MKDFAFYLESKSAIYWWHRIAARQDYHLQGWRQHRVYPDFVACRKDDGTLLILETKGAHLKGNEDTAYKQKLLNMLETTYKTAVERGRLEIREPSADVPAAVFRMMFENDWEENLTPLVGEKH